MKLNDILSRRDREDSDLDGEPADGEAPAWLASLVFHLLLMVGLALFWIDRPRQEAPIVLTALESQVEEEIVPEDFAFSPEANTEIGSNSVSGDSVAMASAPIVDRVSQIAAEETVVEFQPIDRPSLLDVSLAPTLDQNLLVKGAAGVGATGADGAIDQITERILDSLEHRGDTLVVWLFDQSLSMQAQRELVADRFERIYEELEAIRAKGNKAFENHHGTPLLSAVMAFGQEVSFPVGEPTDNVEELRKAVRGIANDTSGVEMTFNAVAMAVKKYKKYMAQAPKRQVLTVVVSDEVGDDINQSLEFTIQQCVRYAIPVYVVGVPAPFGRTEIEVKFVDPDSRYNQDEIWPFVKQGPESFEPEGVRLALTGASRDDEYTRLDSGFGPYALTRLCYESGGMYFCVHPNKAIPGKKLSDRDVPVMASRIRHFFDPAIMRNYQPDYVPIREYLKMVSENKARQALIEASRFSQVSPMENPRMEFPKSDEAGLKRMLDEAQRDAAIITPKVEALYRVLAAGEKAREELVQPRWMAGYDLAMGRVLAVLVRTRSYNAMLAKAKSGLKLANPENDTFLIVPDDEISVGSDLEKMAAQAKKYLERVVKDHEGTPWALLASRELREPLGWKWSEKRVNYPPPPAMVAAAGGGGNAPPAPARPIVLPKPTRPNIKL